MNFKDNSKVIILIFLLALLMRLAYIVFIPQLEGEELGDTWTYDRLALSLISGEGYSGDVRWPPLFPLFLAGIYAVFGHSFFTVRIVQTVIASLTCIIIYLIGKNVFNQRIGLLSGLVAVFYPGFIFYSGLLLTETLGTFLVASSIYLLIKAVAHKSRWRWYAFTGIALGLLSLCRSEMLFFPIFILVVLLLIHKHKKQALTGFLILSCLTALTVLPRTIHNYILFHRVIPITVGFGRSLWRGSYSEEMAGHHANKIKVLYEENTQIELNEKLKRKAWENIKTHPFSYLGISIKKFFRFWITSHSNTFKGLGESFASTIQNKKYDIFFGKLFLLGINMALILLGFLGIFITRRRWKITSVLLVIIIYKVLVHMVLYCSPRYQITIMPVMLVFTAAGMQYLWYLTVYRDRQRLKSLLGVS